MTSSNRFLTLLQGMRTLVSAIDSSAGSGDAGKIICTSQNGKIDSTLLPNVGNLSLGANNGFRMYDDFVCNSGVFSTFASGSGSNASPIHTNAQDFGGHPGILVLATGSTGAGYARIGTQAASDNMNRVLLGYASWEMETMVQFLALRNTTDEFNAHVGFADAPSIVNITDGIVFTYSIDSLFWVCKTFSNGVSSTVTTTIPVNNNQWYKLRIKINDAADQVLFYINDSLVATITTTIPKGAGRQTQPSIVILKTVGTASRAFLIDYLDLVTIFTTPRTTA